MSLLVPGAEGGWISLSGSPEGPSQPPHPGDPAWDVARHLVDALSDEAGRRGKRYPSWREASRGDAQFTATVVARLLAAGVIDVGPAARR